VLAALGFGALVPLYPGYFVAGLVSQLPAVDILQMLIVVAVNTVFYAVCFAAVIALKRQLLNSGE
jgi:hypothetical protein